MRIPVTGSSGLVGGHVFERLRSSGIHVRGVAEMVVLALERDEAVGEVLNRGTGKEVSVNELARLMSISGRRVGVEYREARPGDVRRSCADIRKAQRVLGFRPRVSLEEGLGELLRLRGVV